MRLDQRIKEVLKRKGLMFEGLKSDPKSRDIVLELRERFLEGKDLEKLTAAVNDQEIASLMFGLSPVPIREIPQEMLGIEGEGMVFLVDYGNRRLTGTVIKPTSKESPVSHKLAMDRNLFLMAIMRGTIPDDNIDTLVDCGIINSALATKFICDSTGYNGLYFMPIEMTYTYHADLVNYNFEIRYPSNKYARLVAKNRIDVENATFFTLNDAIKRGELPNCCYLGHSELGAFALYPEGQDITRRFRAEVGTEPDAFVTCIGAGTTIASVGMALHDSYGTELIVVEALEYPNLANQKGKHVIPYDHIPDFASEVTRLDLDRARFCYNSPILGRNQILMLGHEGVMNKYNGWAFDKVETVYLIGDDPFLAALRHLHRNGERVGRTTAALMPVAAEEARKGKMVVVPSFEPYRDYNPSRKDVPWLARWETPAQKISAVAASIGWFVAAGYVFYDALANNTPFFNGFGI